MTQLRALLVILALCLSAAALAQDSVSREAWSNHMEAALPDYLCQEDSYFVQCFELDLAQCRHSLGELTRRCLDRFADDIPDPIRPAEDGAIIGQMVGSCAGTQFDYEHRALKIDNPQCNDPMHWAGR